MYERSYGYRYAELGEHPSAAEIAKAIRSDIKQAQTEGLLPSTWSYSVRSDTFSGGQSVDISVQDCPDAWKPCDGTNGHGAGCSNVWCSARNDPAYAHAAERHDVLTADAEAAKMTLQRIHNAYNHDGSEIMVDYFDVRYYGAVTFETADSYEFRMQEKERLATRKTARENGTPTGLYINYARDGRQTVHVTVQTDEGKTVLACGARLWRSSLGQRADFGTHDVTCSRCAKVSAP